MDDARHVPIVSPADAEEFFATGYNALTCEPDSACESAGPSINARNAYPSITVDVPAVGVTRSDQLPSLRTDGAVLLPDPLQDFVEAMGPEGLIVRLTADEVLEMRALDRADRERNLLLSLLLFASRDLAQSRIMHAGDRGDAAVLMPSWCMECQHNEANGGIVHAATCKTGRVLDVLLELMQAAAKPALHENLEGKYTAPDLPGAPPNAPPRGLNARVCLKCGKRDGNWIAVQRPEAEVDLEMLGLNQCVGAGVNGDGHMLHTHQCAGPEGGAQ